MACSGDGLTTVWTRELNRDHGFAMTCRSNHINKRTGRWYPNQFFLKCHERSALLHTYKFRFPTIGVEFEFCIGDDRLTTTMNGDTIQFLPYIRAGWERRMRRYKGDESKCRSVATGSPQTFKNAIRYHQPVRS